jgi:ParB-like chromosome segregation protein Spo0J
MAALAQRCAYTHEMLAKKLGKSRVAVTESLALQAMPDEIKNLCRLADITSKSLLLQIVRQGEPEKMAALIERIASQGRHEPARSSESRRARAKKGRPKAFTFSYRPESKAFNLKLSFSKAKPSARTSSPRSKPSSGTFGVNARTDRSTVLGASAECLVRCLVALCRVRCLDASCFVRRTMKR